VSELADRAVRWAQQRSERIGGHNPWLLTVRLLREVIADRVTGLAAEMAFFALLSLVPLLVASGAALGYVRRFVAFDEVLRARQFVVSALGAVFTPEVTNDVLEPLINGLLFAERGGVALGSLLVTLWLASRVFAATIRALDLAYDVPERRGLARQRLLAVAFALGAVLIVPLTLVLMVVGPLLGGGRQLADRLGLGSAFEVTWAVGRWPLLAVLLVGFLAALYRYGPAVRHPWRRCLPGAVVGLVLEILVSLGFRVYLAAGGGQTDGFAATDEAVALLGRVIGALVAAVLWIYLSAIVVLVGGELNAELVRGADA
jgi:membrane protein